MTAPTLTVRRTSVSPNTNGDGGFWAVDDNGDVTLHPTPEHVVRSLKRRDTRRAKAGESTATVIEWLRMPADFEPPAVAS